MNLLRASSNNAVKRFIFVSTCAVYGEAKYLPIDEQHPTNLASPYAISKLEAEHYCKKLQNIYGLKTTIRRLFNVYGPRIRKDQYGGVITRAGNWHPQK
jgi:UDP-glucose 4-epimerase